MIQDLVCGAEVDEHVADAKGLYRDVEGTRFRFCSEGCLAQFDAHPMGYTMAEEEWRASDEGMREFKPIPPDEV